MFSGEYSHVIDAKKRIFIPAQFREELGQRFYFCKSMPGNTCVLVYSESGYADRVNAVKQGTSVHFQRFINEGAQLVESDKSGRVTIPQKLFEYAELNKNIIIFGMTDHIELWDRDKLTAEYEMGKNEEISPELREYLY